MVLVIIICENAKSTFWQTDIKYFYLHQQFLCSRKNSAVLKTKRFLCEKSPDLKMTYVELLTCECHITGFRFPLRHKGSEESDEGVGNRDQDDVFVLQLTWEQQWNNNGGRTDTRDHLLHLDFILLLDRDTKLVRRQEAGTTGFLNTCVECLMNRHEKKKMCLWVFYIQCVYIC